MTDCIRDQSRRYLAGGLSAAEESAFIEHLDVCRNCQSWLEEAAGGDEAWQLTRELLAISCTKDFDTNSTSNLIDEEHSAKSSHPELALLNPSDDPAMLGRLGSLEVIGVLGRGGMGVVFKCFDQVLRRNVAVKLLDPVLANLGTARQRFAREARAMAAISHEHVVPIYAVDEHAALPYIVMEYVPGGTLEHRLHREGPLEVVEVVRVALQVAAALSAAHRQGLIHRDIKPSNILLDQGTERVRVTDFGLARASNDGGFTRSGTLTGTPQYMAPEQIRGEACDAQSDLFSLGSVMYTLCAGHPPFRGETVYAVMQRIVHDQPRSLREQDANIPDWLEDFIFRLLAKEKSNRFATADEVVKILEGELAYQQGPQVECEPSRIWRKARSASNSRQTRRRSQITTITLAVVIAAISGVLIVSTLINSAVDPAVPATNFSVSANDPIAPLWDFDGMRETIAAARAMEAQSRTTLLNSEPDFWQQQTAQIRQRVAEVAANQDLWNAETP